MMTCQRNPKTGGIVLCGDDPVCGAWHIFIGPDGMVDQAASKITVPPFTPPALPPKPAGGPGTELRALLASLKITEIGCGCGAFADWMDSIGVKGCRQHKHIVTARLVEQAEKSNWMTRINAASIAAVRMPGMAVAFVAGGAPRALLWLVELAVSNAAAKESKACAYIPSATA